MNDFTKEELKELLSALSVFSGSPRGISLFHKIQSLIDNYCDHEKTVEDSAMVKICVKCRRSL